MPQTTSRFVNGICPHDCPDACGMVTEVADGRAIRVSGQTDHPVTRGWLCAKVNPYLERVYHPDRLQQPMRRKGAKGSGQWQTISWEAAIDEIATRWQSLIREHGAESILPYSYSGTLGLVQMVVASARLWNRLGASRLQRSICMAATRHAVRSTLGARMSPPYHHVLDSKLLVFWGHNPVSTAPHLMPFVRDAQHNGCRLVVIDPWQSRSTGHCDLLLQPYPGTDGALALGVARQIIVEDKMDQEWLENNTHGWPRFRDHVMQFDLERCADITGVPTEQIRQFANLYTEHRPAMIRLGDAVNRNLQGGQSVRAIASLPALTGQYGVRGGGLSCSTGDYFLWDDEAINRWQDCPPAGREINMNRIGAALCGEISNPRIESLFVFCANPMVSAPRTGLVRQGLMRDDLFTVVHDLFMTDTARYADIVLPATSQLEHVDLHRGYGHTLLGYNHAAIPPLGQSKSNWEVMQMLADALGFDEPWLHESTDQVIEGILDATRDHNERLQGITLDTLKQNPSVEFAGDDEVPFADGHFPTPSGKVELYSETLAAEGLNPLPDWSAIEDADDAELEDSLRLISPAAHYFVNSSLANLPSLTRRQKSTDIVMHPEDAAQRNLLDGERVRVHNARGECFRELHISDRIRPGVAMAVNGFWSSAECPDTINWTTSDRLADMAGQSTFQSNRVRVEKFDPDQPRTES